MKKYLAALAFAGLLVSSASFAEPVRDWHDLERIHKHVQASIQEMEKARAANHYDMDGHGEKAEQLLRETEVELKAAVESAKQAK